MMRAAIVIVLVCGMPALAQDRDAEDRRLLAGTWTVTAAEQGGRPFDVIKGGALTITDREFSLRTATGNEFTGEIRVDASTSPRQLDFVHADGTVWEAIYSVSGDVFRLNYVDVSDGAPRPTLFATSADLLGTVIVMRRTP